MADLTERWVAQASLVDLGVEAVVDYLDSVFALEFSKHETCVDTFEPDAAGVAIHTVKSSVDYDGLCRALARAASERSGLRLFEHMHQGLA